MISFFILINDSLMYVIDTFLQYFILSKGLDMKKGNIVDLNTYRHQEKSVQAVHMMSDELKQAIQNLIDRLREYQPLAE